MIVHELKTIPPFFQDVLEGRKTFELRKDDRGFSEGDELWLREWVSGRGFTGRSIRKRVVYMIGHDEVLPASITGLVDGHVILGLAPEARAEKAEQERDALQAMAAAGVLDAQPMTTVDEDGRVWRMEMATDGADCLYLTREGFATTIPAHSADRALYVLVPIEDAPSEGEGE